jgi:hypothetical protein
MYYSKLYYKLLGYEKSTRKGKMYDALLERKEDNKVFRVPFGDSSMENFGDKTGLNLYPNLLHHDEERRRLFRARAVGFIKDGHYSPGWFSYNVLW